MAMKVITLKYDARCQDCGAELKAGTRARVYPTRGGRLLIYGLTCHKRGSDGGVVTEQTQEDVQTAGEPRDLVDTEKIIERVRTVHISEDIAGYMEQVAADLDLDVNEAVDLCLRFVRAFMTPEGLEWWLKWLRNKSKSK